MKIGSIRKTSLLDFPRKVSAVVGTQGCNMHCPWCHNPYLIAYDFGPGSNRIEENQLTDFLAQREKFLDGVVITGGEPTIQPDLPEFCERLKGLGFAVKLDTNGTHPGMLGNLIENGLVDYVAMDVKTTLAQYGRLCRRKSDPNQIRESIDLLRSASIPHEFRTTCVGPFVTLAGMDEIGGLIEGAQTYFLQRCIPPEVTRAGGRYTILDENELAALKTRVMPHVTTCQIR
ncbi:MAG: anaerobic ribonucleoside-triphosphate reductase activating protein [Desulfosarcina sp.]